MTVAN